jgi:transcriptional regulator with PAS, ATPase and Fis domain
MLPVSSFRAQAEEPIDANVLLLGNHPSLLQLRSEIESAARSDAKVLIEGETGVGKEVVARLVHQASARRRHHFMAINCAALPDALIESELFGHVRGSFTDAYRDKPGLAVLADRGTLFLDEIGEMSPRMQAVLLRFTETREIQRIGADRLNGIVDTRIIAATHRNLPERIAAGEFRQDLYYRLHVIHITVPPLRERGSDILLLFQHFLTHHSRLEGLDVPAIDPSAEALLLAYGWPGNVRELKNVAERIVVRGLQGPITSDTLPPEIRAAAHSGRQSVAGMPPGHVPLPRHPAAEAAWDRMIDGRESFWAVVHPLFIDRELTKTDLRHIIRRGLEQTQGSYRKLTDLFNISPGDYKRFLAFLYQHDCHLAFHPFREPRGSQDSRMARASGA